ncbi:hypothetical protein MC885_014302 [Smutsia gigantea]|nr:hypothetical protein MC885_014302 [Smutsia gigantea]
MAEKDKVIKILQQQIGNMMQLVGQRCQTTRGDLELGKVKLVNANSEHLQAEKDVKERDQLLNEEKTSRNDLNSLTEDYGVLKRNF